MFDDQGGCEWVNLFILLAAYPGCPGQGAVKPVCVCVLYSTAVLSLLVIIVSTVIVVL